MLDVQIYGEKENAWCPGCGNHDILAAVKQAFAICELPPERVLMVSGIGQAAKAPLYVKVNCFSGLHGRALPAATGARLANPELAVVVESGDGCLYGEGGNHFMAAIRRNINLTVLVHNNGIYGLTKGQASPTSTCQLRPQSHPYGIFNQPFHPLSVALVLGAGFVARGFSGDKENLPHLMAEAIKYPGFALLDIVTPCVSFNKYNTFAWYKKHCQPLPTGYKAHDKQEALLMAEKWEEGIPLGVLYKSKEPAPTFESRFPALKRGPVALQNTDLAALTDVQNAFR